MNPAPDDNRCMFAAARPIPRCSVHAAALLRTLGMPVGDVLPADPAADAAAWADSGLMALSGAADGAGQPCAAPLAAQARAVLETWHAAFGPSALDILDGAALCAERAALLGLQRAGTTAAGGSCRLLQVADGWLAINLAREDDAALLPAWLEDETATPEHLPALLRTRGLHELLDRGRVLGLAVAAATRPPIPERWFQCLQRGRPRAHGTRPWRVLDLSALWAGPLCAQLLRLAGAEVVKLESSGRPDGARRGNAEFYDLMNHGKRSVALDFGRDEGRRALRALIAQADVVIESARPRGLRQLGIVAEDCVAQQPGLVWLAISAHGRDEEREHWIGYGDDAAIAGGLGALALDDGGGMRFHGDAIGDPLTGLHAALLARSALEAGGGALLSISLSGLVAWLARDALQQTPAQLQAARRSALAHSPRLPQPRYAPAAAAALGADTQVVLADWCAAC